MAFNFLRNSIKPGAKFSERDPNQETPVFDEMVMARINNNVRRRFTDRVEGLLRASTAAGDLQTASDLLTVLANVQERGRRRFGRERRVSDDPVARARAELVKDR